jgi:uncharacterized protein involved in type VI secretion and phage assembly
MSTGDAGGITYYGKYAGTVIDNVDPDNKGRLMVEVPDVLGAAPSSWAEPCTPLAGPTGAAMGVYLVPPIGAGVWVEFAQGDPEYPIWVGCRWGETADLPEMALEGLPETPSIVLQTATKNTIVISDVAGPSGGIMLRVGASTLTVTDDGISLDAPKVEITATTISLTGTTDVNDGALHIT